MTRIRSDLLLTPVEACHAPRMCRWMQDQVVRDGVGLRTTATLETTLDWIRRAQEDSTIRAFAILQGGEHVGNVILDRIDSYLQMARLSIYVGEPLARNSGVGRTALFLAAQHGFTQMDLHKIWLTVHAQNIAAIRSYLHVGFQLEGVLRDEFLLDGRRLPALYMGLVREEFLRRQTAAREQVL